MRNVLSVDPQATDASNPGIDTATLRCSISPERTLQTLRPGQKPYHSNYCSLVLDFEDVLPSWWNEELNATWNIDHNGTVPLSFQTFAEHTMPHPPLLQRYHARSTVVSSPCRNTWYSCDSSLFVGSSLFVFRWQLEWKINRNG